MYAIDDLLLGLSFKFNRKIWETEFFEESENILRTGKLYLSNSYWLQFIYFLEPSLEIAYNTFIFAGNIPYYAGLLLLARHK
jgi:hypothetical protein